MFLLVGRLVGWHTHTHKSENDTMEAEFLFFSLNQEPGKKKKKAKKQQRNCTQQANRNKAVQKKQTNKRGQRELFIYVNVIFILFHM